MRRIFLLFVIPLIFFSCKKEDIYQGLSVEKGVLDLRGQTLGGDWLVPLTGDWAFYWDRFADSETAGNYVAENATDFIKVPRYWNVGPDAYPSFGNVVFALTILTGDNKNLLGFKVNNLNPNFLFFANGKRIYQCGEPHPDQTLSRPGNVSLILPLVPENGRIDLVITMSNWHTNRPGLYQNPMLGNYDTVLRDLMRVKMLESLFIGGMLLLSLYLFSSFLYNREDQGRLWLSFVILSAALYASVKGPLVLIDLFPRSGGEVRSKIIYLVLLCYPYFTYMQYRNQKNLIISRPIGKIDSVVVALMSLVIILTRKSFFTRFELFFLIHALSLSFYVIFVLFRNLLREKTLDALLSLVGDFLLLTAVIFSVINNSYPVLVSGLAVYFFCFCLFQTVLQARFASKSLLMVKVLSERNRTLRDQKDQYENQALMDHLTRVKNRRSLDSFLRKSWDMSVFLRQGIGIIMVDIDFFKKYNDSLGHKEGDVCLVRVAEALSRSLKRNQDFIARYGGEEFIVIIQGADSPESLIQIGEHLREAVEGLHIPHPDSDCSTYVTISVGAEYHVPVEGGIMAEDLIHRADTALYLAKNRGRNRVETINAFSLENAAEDILE